MPLADQPFAATHRVLPGHPLRENGRTLAGRQDLDCALEITRGGQPHFVHGCNRLVMRNISRRRFDVFDLLILHIGGDCEMRDAAGGYRDPARGFTAFST